MALLRALSGLEVPRAIQAVRRDALRTLSKAGRLAYVVSKASRLTFPVLDAGGETDGDSILFRCF